MGGSEGYALIMYIEVKVTTKEQKTVLKFNSRRSLGVWINTDTTERSITVKSKLEILNFIVRQVAHSVNYLLVVSDT